MEGEKEARSALESCVVTLSLSTRGDHSVELLEKAVLPHVLVRVEVALVVKPSLGCRGSG